jgi:hypothetical protein
MNLKMLAGLPAQPDIFNLNWSLDQSVIAITRTTSNDAEVGTLGIENATARKVAGGTVNENIGIPISWFKDGNSLLVKMLSDQKEALIDTSIEVLLGPTISTSDGSKAQNRTLTPVGFQSEECNYWDAPDVYNTMSLSYECRKSS